MNRTIKFRAWEKKTKKMHQPGSNGNYWANGVCGFGTDSLGEIDKIDIVRWVAVGSPDPDPEIKTLFSHEYILMQYTGLKDKNGVEIYESDIVELSLVEHFTQRFPGKRLAFVGWFIDCYRLTLIDSSIDSFQLSDFCEDEEALDLEVVGNVWEHPELLEGTNVNR